MNNNSFLEDPDENVYIRFGVEITNDDGLEALCCTAHEGVIEYSPGFLQEPISGVGNIRAVQVDPSQSPGSNIASIAAASNRLAAYTELFEHIDERCFDTAPSSWHNMPVLVVDSITVAPQYRGCNIGLEALEATLRVLASGVCVYSLVVNRPLQFEAFQNPGTDAQDLGLEPFACDPQVARNTLGSYWVTADFVPLDPYGYFYGRWMDKDDDLFYIRPCPSMDGSS